MQQDYYLNTKEEGTVDFVVGGMVPSFPFERIGGALILKIYDQDGELHNLPVADTKDNEMFGVWLRRFDRFSGQRISHGD